MEISELSKILRESGVVGAGGAGFPTYGKLSDKVDTIILNCAECEPLLKLHRQLLEARTYEIIKALTLIADTVGAKEIIIGVKEEYKSTIRALESCVDSASMVRIHKLPGAYPMGDEVVLIYETTGKVVRPGGLPVECGIAVFNVETAFNVYRAVWEKKPVIEKCVTVAGEVKNPGSFMVPIGMGYRELIALAGGVTTDNPVYLSGGPMMGNLVPLATTVTKTTNAVIVLPEDHIYVQKKQVKFKTALLRAQASCCQCTTCTDLCPRHNLGHPIEPHMFMRAATNSDTKDISAYINTMFCSSCGLCENYSCPQGLSPRSMMAEFKANLRKSGVKPPVVEAAAVKESRQYRRVPEERLLARLGLKEYDKDALLSEEVVYARLVRIKLSQHIGAKAVPVVKEGENVSKGQMIAAPAEGLSVGIHSSLNGRVSEITDQYIVIVNKEA